MLNLDNLDPHGRFDDYPTKSFAEEGLLFSKAFSVGEQGDRVGFPGMKHLTIAVHDPCQTSMRRAFLHILVEAAGYE